MGYLVVMNWSLKQNSVAHDKPTPSNEKINPFLGFYLLADGLLTWKLPSAVHFTIMFTMLGLCRHEISNLYWIYQHNIAILRTVDTQNINIKLWLGTSGVFGQAPVQLPLVHHVRNMSSQHLERGGPHEQEAMRRGEGARLQLQLGSWGGVYAQAGDVLHFYGLACQVTVRQDQLEHSRSMFRFLICLGSGYISDFLNLHKNWFLQDFAFCTALAELFRKCRRSDFS